MVRLTVNRIKEKICNKICDYFLVGKKPFKKYNHNIEYFKRSILISDEFKPVFFLSTGRTGTKLMTEILKFNQNILVKHSPKPEFIKEGKLVYELLKGETANNVKVKELIFSTFLAAREQLLYRAYNENKVYVETNNRITFFAPFIKEYIPNAKFVYLYRHPGEFVRSGIRRKWYSGQHEHDIGRITPININESEWENFTDIEKISWLWYETNNFVESFLDSQDQEDFLRVNFNELDEEVVNEILQFIGVKNRNEKIIKELLNVKVNKQKEGAFEIYQDWNSKQKQQLKVICNDLAKKYGYKL